MEFSESPVSKWFQTNFATPTPPQREAWPRIFSGKDVLVASPTGTGKTFAAFFAVLDRLALEHAQARLTQTVRCIYVSPLRALGYDLEKNLQEPLREIYGAKPPIHVELRSGDTRQAQRARQFAKPPHIILTTPESLCVLLSQERWMPQLSTVDWIIIDEIHALAGNKRGAHLSLSVERLAYEVERRGRRLQRIGLSATVAPLDEVAQYLSGTRRMCEVIDVSSEKKVELSIYTPLRKNPYPPSGFTGERLVKELGDLVKRYRTTLVFCNTRSGAEATSFWLRENFPELAGQIECHHASLERGVRREVEDRLKRGELRAVICSTSLELGIDIGSVDLVVMLATPKGVSRALQRAGRAGHNIHSVSRGVLMATNVSDLVEACATVQLARTRRLDYIKIPEAPLDVLAQHVVSMGCIQSWTHADALALVRRSYCYANLTEEELFDVLEYLAGGGKSLRQQYTEVFGKIEWDGETFATREGRVRREFLQNIGTIPDAVSVRVRMKRKALGSVEESFMRMLKIGDVFIMAGRSVRLEKVTQLEAWVAAADGETPTVPRWNAAKMPLSNRVCEEIVAFRSELKKRLESDPRSREKREQDGNKNSPHAAWIMARLDCGKANAEMIWQMYDAQHRISEIPTADFLLVEEHVEYPKDHLPEELAAKKRGGQTGRKTTMKNASGPRARHYFFHSLIGRAANDALARVVSYRLSRIRGGNAIATPHDYGFVLSVAPQQEFTEAELPALLAPEQFEGDLEAALAESEMVKYHFRNAAQTGLMVYRNYFDERKPMRKVHWSSEVIFNVLQRYEPDHILLREARREALHVYVDAAGAREFVHEQARASRPFAKGQLRAATLLPHVCHQDQRSAPGGGSLRDGGAVISSLVESDRERLSRNFGISTSRFSLRLGGLHSEVERLNRLPAIRAPYPPQRLEISSGVFLDSRRAIWIEREKTLAVADLHLGFAWAHRAEGNLLPLSSPEDTVARLSSLAADYPVHTVLVLGDIVHRAVPIEPVRAELRRLCTSLPDAELQLIAGNHDRALASMLRDCKIALPLLSEACVGPHTFLHGDKTPSQPAYNPEGLTFIGHEHPAIRLGDGISSVKCPCFLIGKTLIVLPAFSSWAAGTDVRTAHFLSPLAKGGKFTKAVAILAGKLLPIPL